MVAMEKEVRCQAQPGRSSQDAVNEESGEETSTVGLNMYRLCEGVRSLSDMIEGLLNSETSNGLGVGVASSFVR